MGEVSPLKALQRVLWYVCYIYMYIILITLELECLLCQLREDTSKITFSPIQQFWWAHLSLPGFPITRRLLSLTRPPPSLLYKTSKCFNFKYLVITEKQSTLFLQGGVACFSLDPEIQFQISLQADESQCQSVSCPIGCERRWPSAHAVGLKTGPSDLDQSSSVETMKLQVTVVRIPSQKKKKHKKTLNKETSFIIISKKTQQKLSFLRTLWIKLHIFYSYLENDRHQLIRGYTQGQHEYVKNFFFLQWCLLWTFVVSISES